MSRLSTILRIVGCAFVLSVAPQSAKSNQALKCRAITAHTSSDLQIAGCTSPVGLCTLGRVTGDSWLNGTYNYIAPQIAPSAGLADNIEPPSTVAYGGDFTVFNALGSITFQTIGVYDTALQLWTEVDRVVRGTGFFQGAIGAVYINGVGLGGGTRFEGAASGQICVPQ